MASPTNFTLTVIKPPHYLCLMVFVSLTLHVIPCKCNLLSYTLSSLIVLSAYHHMWPFTRPDSLHIPFQRSVQTSLKVADTPSSPLPSWGVRKFHYTVHPLSKIVQTSQGCPLGRFIAAEPLPPPLRGRVRKFPLRCTPLSGSV